MAELRPSVDDHQVDQPTSRPHLPDPLDWTNEDGTSTDEVLLDNGVPVSLERFHQDSVDPSMLSYLCMITSLIERRTITQEELLKMLARSVRQRSMYRTSRIDYVLSYLNKHPP
jgi:hypothetical protein